MSYTRRDLKEQLKCFKILTHINLAEKNIKEFDDDTFHNLKRVQPSN